VVSFPAVRAGRSLFWAGFGVMVPGTAAAAYLLAAGALCIAPLVIVKALSHLERLVEEASLKELGIDNYAFSDHLVLDSLGGDAYYECASCAS
jgi:hypothetical protein